MRQRAQENDAPLLSPRSESSSPPRTKQKRAHSDDHEAAAAAATSSTEPIFAYHTRSVILTSGEACLVWTSLIIIARLLFSSCQHSLAQPRAADLPEQKVRALEWLTVARTQGDCSLVMALPLCRMRLPPLPRRLHRSQLLPPFLPQIATYLTSSRIHVVAYESVATHSHLSSVRRSHESSTW